VKSREYKSLNGQLRWGTEKEMLFRCYLPYGIWTCDDGREVMFNRFYEPIWERANGVTTIANPKERIPWRNQMWFFADGNPPWYNRNSLLVCLRELKNFGGTWKPIERYAPVKHAMEEI
jgi:hypothetical protein